MKPIADALKILQGDSYMYMGIFSPCVLKMYTEIKAEQDLLHLDDPLRFLTSTILSAIKKR